MVVREERGQFIVEPAEAPKRKIDLTGIVGAVPGLRALSPGDRLFGERELDWNGGRAGRG